MPYKKPITSANRRTRSTQYQREQEQSERDASIGTHRHQAGGAPQGSRLTAAVRTVAYIVWTAVIVLLAGFVAVSVTRMLPPGPGGIVLIVTGVGLLAAAPTVARRTFVRGLTAIERRFDDRQPPEGHPHRDPIVAEESKAVVRQVYDAWDEGDFERIDDLVTGDVDSHNPLLGTLSDGLVGAKQAPPLSHSTSPVAEIDIDELIAEGNTVAVRWTGTVTDTHDGSRRDGESTGTEGEVMGLGLSRVEDGKIADSWGVIDIPRGDNGGR